MLAWELAFAIIPGLILFLYGIENFSTEIQRISGEKFRSLLKKATDNPVKGAFLGAIVTAAIQSSTATTVITVGLVNAGVLSFAQSLGIIFGANVGTTVTAQLVALKLTSFAPYFILFGFLLGLFGGKFRFIGKPVFYFGLVFFGLTLISSAIEPVRASPEIAGIFSQFSDITISLGAGILFTILVQSSSVTTGVAVLLVGSGLLSLEQAIPVIMGANIGTTTTSLLASLRMDLFARRSAMAHFLFNVFGVLLFLPFLGVFANSVSAFGGMPEQQIANAHLIINLVAAAIFILAIKPFSRMVMLLVPGNEKETLFKVKFLPDKLPKKNSTCFRLVEKELSHAFEVTYLLFANAEEVIQTGSEGKMQKIAKLEALNDFLDRRISHSILSLSHRKLTAKEARKTVLLVRMSNTIEQVGDLAVEMARKINEFSQAGIRLPPSVVGEIMEVHEKVLYSLKVLKKNVPFMKSCDRRLIRKNDNELREMINQKYSEHLRRLSSKKAYAGSAFVELLSLQESANAKLREIRKFSESYSRLCGKRIKS